MSRPDRIAALLARYDASAAAVAPLGVLLDRLAKPEAPTSVHEPDRALDVHVADSLAGLEVPEVRSATLLADLGAGAGLPGLVLATVLPRARVTLVESVEKKCAFAEATASAMGVENVEVVCARAEDWVAGRERCDVVCARALAALPVLCEYAAPLLRDGGVLVAWKGAVNTEEGADGAAAAEVLRLRLEPALDVTPFRGSGRRTLHVARKIGPTPPGFPRRAGMATKRPLSATKPHRERKNSAPDGQIRRRPR